MIKRVLKAVVLFVIIFTVGNVAQARMVKENLGTWYVTTYHASDNTPSGSHETSSGAYATEGYTAAVDNRNPLVPMGSLVDVEGYGTFKVQDYGGFGNYNGGRRALDLFMPEGVGFCKPLEITLIRPETDKERKARIERANKKRRFFHRLSYTVVYDPELLPYQAITYSGVIKSGTIRFKSKSDHIRYTWFDVVNTKPGNLRVIYVGNRWQAENEPIVWLDEVIENAKG